MQPSSEDMVMIERYMRAHVRMNSVHDPDEMGLEELTDCFSLLERPQVPFDEWCLTVGYERKPSTEEMALANEQAKKDLEKYAKKED